MICSKSVGPHRLNGLSADICLAFVRKVNSRSSSSSQDLIILNDSGYFFSEVYPDNFTSASDNIFSSSLRFYLQNLNLRFDLALTTKKEPVI